VSWGPGGEDVWGRLRGRTLRRGGVLLLLSTLLMGVDAWAGTAVPVPQRPEQPQDPCLRVLGQSATHLRQILDARLRRRFPVTAQLAEGNAQLSGLDLRVLDCEQRRLIVSSTYKFRGNIGVMDLTRRGTLVMQLRLTPQAGQRQVRLEGPEVLDITFDNPAPWFDGKAIQTWAIELLSTPICAYVQNGQPC
jgi:hypothetical protein